MSLNPISKIIYHTPNSSSEQGLSELVEVLGSKIQSKWGKDKLDLVTHAPKALIEIQFKDGSKHELDINYARNIKHSLESLFSQSTSKEDFESLSVIVI
ncbi:MAG TPA: hypothetical protein PLW93_02630 [Candidatus Absconditabacterales bacterium]|nr:hypothetical protein [Candidatus Absconditabacterales bacterium]HNG97145.1 hypothetical protein [Candidatus Absconditabacterales bacterium]